MTPFTMIRPRLFHTFLFGCHPGIYVSNGVPRGITGNGEAMKPSPLVELNPNMLVRDVERMSNP